MAPKLSQGRRGKGMFNNPISAGLFINPLAETRYSYMSTSRASWMYERHINFSSFSRFRLEEKFEGIGLRPLLNLDFPADKDLARLFWANLSCSTHEDVREAIFTSFVGGKKFSFNLHQICQSLGVSDSGYDPTSCGDEMFLLKIIEFLTRTPLRTYHGLEPPSTRLYYKDVPIEMTAAAYILRHNLFPLGGEFIDEITNESIVTLWCMFKEDPIEPINVESILFYFFRIFATEPMHLVPFPRLVAFILSELDIFTHLGTPVNDPDEVYFSRRYAHKNLTFQGSINSTTVTGDNNDSSRDPFDFPIRGFEGSSSSSVPLHPLGGDTSSCTSSSIENFIHDQTTWKNSFTEEVYNRFDHVDDQNNQHQKDLRNITSSLEGLWNIWTSPKKPEEDEEEFDDSVRVDYRKAW